MWNCSRSRSRTGSEALGKPMKIRSVEGRSERRLRPQSRSLTFSVGEMVAHIKNSYLPYALSLGFILLDYSTMRIGLSMGFSEIHPAYSPLNALLIFWGSITLLTLSLPKTRFWRISIVAFSLISCLGAVNNILVLAGLFGGLAI